MKRSINSGRLNLGYPRAWERPLDTVALLEHNMIIERSRSCHRVQRVVNIHRRRDELDTASILDLFKRAVRERQIKISLHAAEEALAEEITKR